MKNIYKPLLFLLFSFISIQANAVLVLGSELRWKTLGNDSIEITAIIYTDCNGTPLGDTIDIKLQSLDSNHHFVNILKLTKTFSSEVTGQCPGFASRCQSSTSSFPYGIEKKIYVDTVDLSAQSSCKFRISFSQCCRQGTAFIDGALYTFTDINSCDTLINSSPVFQNEPQFLICAGACYSYRLNGTDPDGDSVVYEMVASQTDSSSLSGWYSPYSYDKPLYFNGFPNPGLPFNPPLCRGFHLDPFLGVLLFRPMQAQSTWIAVEATEYRNGTKIGSARREWQQSIMNCPPNNTPIFSGASAVRVCVGDTLKYDLTITDIDSMDSLSAQYFDLPAGASMTFTGTGDTLYGHLKWVPQAADTPIYYITFQAKDNACPIPGKSVKSLRINIDTFPTIQYAANAIGCGRVLLNASVLNGMSYGWQLDTVTLAGNSQTYKYDTGGMKHFTLMAEYQSCSRMIPDSVSVPNYNKLVISAGPDTAVCRSDSFSIVASIISGNGNYSYFWLPDSLYSKNYRNLFTTADLVTLQVTDAVGCSASDQVYVFLLPPPAITTKSVKACGNTDTLNLAAYASPAGGTWSGPGVNNGKLALSHVNYGDWLHYAYTDTNGCSNRDSAQLAVGQPPLISAGADIDACISAGLLPLNGSPAGGAWTGTGTIKPTGSQWYFNSTLAGAGTSELVYTFTDSVFCTSTDTIVATVYPLPVLTMPADFSRCIDGGPVVLTAQPAGGSWSGPGVVAGIFYPSNTTAGKHYLHYTYTDSNGCTAKDSIRATVFDLPHVEAGPDISECINGWPIQLKGTPAGGVWSGPDIVAGNFYPSSAGLGEHYLTYSITNSAGCSNSDSLKVTVHDLPQVIAFGDTTICIHENPLNLMGQPAGGVWTGTGTTGNVFIPALAGAGIHKLIYTYTGVCSNSDSIKIKVLPRPSLTASYTPLTKYQMQFNLASPDSLVDFYWDFGDGSDATQRNPLHTYPPGVGSYLVIARSTGANGCWNADTLQVIISNIGMQEAAWLQNIKIYPNPATQKLIIEAANGLILYRAVLQNALGQEVLKLESTESHFEARVSELPAGLYFLELVNSENERALVRVVVQ